MKIEKEGGPIVESRYRDEVTMCHRDLLRASSLWLEKAGVISGSEVEEIGRVWKHRNEVAHELPRLLSQSDLTLNLDYFLRIRELLEQIEVWWIRNIETLIDPMFDSIEVDDIEIRPGRVMDHVISVALSEYLEEE